MPKQTEVVICGAGPAGLALSIELGGRGISCAVFERNDRVGYAPRAKTTHTRTREHFRRWGIAHKLANEAPFGTDYQSDVHFVTRLGGYGLAKIENAFDCSPKQNDLYAEHAQWIPQYKVEEVLREHASSLDCVSIHFEHEFLEAEQAEKSVTSQIHDLSTGVTVEIESSYLVGADGARSQIRDLIGAKMEGQYGLVHAYNIIFKAPGLAEKHPHGPGIIFWITNPEVPGMMGPMDKDDLWYFMPGKVPGLDKIDLSVAEDLIRQATGIDIPYEIMSADEWVSSEFIADAYSDGRIFLIGDACHLHPPTGGYGMNMGIGDSVDLGWKMAAVLQGWGGDHLLHSYEAERKPLHRWVIDAALSNQSSVALHRNIPELIEQDTEDGEAFRAALGEKLLEGRSQEFRSLPVMLGGRYDNSPICAGGDADTIGLPSIHQLDRDARPGARAPHIWLESGESLFDLFGSGFTLIAFAGSEKKDVGAAIADAGTLQIPLKLVEIDEPKVAELFGTRLVLIRPDQHVAWLGEDWPGESILKLASGNISQTQAAGRQDV